VHGWAKLACLAAALPYSAGAQQAPSPLDSPVPVEFSTDFDLRLFAGLTLDHDPGQVLYSQPRPVSYLLRNGDFDFAPAWETGTVPNLQVDALANPRDALFDEVVSNTADLVISPGPDPFTSDLADQPSDIAAFRETPGGFGFFVWANADLAEEPLMLGEVDALELWSSAVGGNDDASYFSYAGDGDGISVFSNPLTPYLTRAQVHQAAASLGYAGAEGTVDLDALMVQDVDPVGEWSVGDQVLFSLRAAANWDGGEIVWLQFTAAAPAALFLNHGGHLWNTAFPVGERFQAATEELDAIEAAPIGRLEVCGIFDPDSDGDMICDAVDTCPNLASHVLGDFDGDGLGNPCDSCPTITNLGLDSDGDGVDNSCDTCTNTANPQVTAFTIGLTRVSFQWDGDGDGKGDACDFDYDNAGIVMTSSDFNYMKASIGQPRSGQTCGGSLGFLCQQFDHNGEGLVITSADFNLAKSAVGKIINGPTTAPPYLKCAACAPLYSPLLTSVVPQPRWGRPICAGPACQY
jgi:hypothetical protein